MHNLRNRTESKMLSEMELHIFIHELKQTVVHIHKVSDLNLIEAGVRMYERQPNEPVIKIRPN